MIRPLSPSRRCPAKGLGALLAAVNLAGCAPGLAPLPTPSPAPETRPSEPVRTESRLTLPSRLPTATFRVTSTARLKASGAGVSGEEQRIESRGLVTWTLTRTPSGALRGTGQVDSFTVRSSLDSTGAARSTRPTPAPAPAPAPAAPTMLLVEATLDSANARVTLRPPLANECDRAETLAASLARDVLVRIPDGAMRGERWRDSTVALVCRSGVPMTMYTVTTSTLESVDTDKLVVSRAITSKLEGKGGSAFRAFDLTGTGSGNERLEVRVSDGSVTKLEGTSTLTLQLRETAPPAAPRSSQVVQRVEMRAERVSR